MKNQLVLTKMGMPNTRPILNPAPRIEASSQYNGNCRNYGNTPGDFYLGVTAAVL